jgi:hypothetical protein
MSETATHYCISLSDCIGLLRSRLEHEDALLYLQAKLEEFGIEFLFQSGFDPGLDALPLEYREHLHSILCALLPWTPGPARADGQRLIGRFRSMSLYVDVYPVEPDFNEHRAGLQAQVEQDYYPERYRRAFGLS